MNTRPEADRRKTLVRDIFSGVAPRYDLLNRLLSLGCDLVWRKAAARRAKLFKTNRILDVATGTGDLAISLTQAQPRALVVGADFTRPMLELAKKKIEARNLADQITLVLADGLNLPFPDQSFDTVTIAFGIRNMPDREKALQEMKRVLTPGGRVLILELTFSPAAGLKRFYRAYLTGWLPRLGGLVSGRGEAYEYLSGSILDFPKPEDFCALMVKAGFQNVGFRSFTFGAAVLHWGERPAEIRD